MEKKRCRRRRERRVYIWVTITLSLAATLYWAIFLSLPSSGSVAPLLPKLSRMRNVNTTSVPWSPNDTWYPYVTLARLLDRHLRQSPEYNVLCMHHLDIRRPYRGCSVESGGFVYFMLNPTLVELGGKNITVYEDSVSCGESIKSTTRRDSIRVTWTDGILHFYTTFTGNVAISLQLILEEFKGDGHCTVFGKV